MSSDRSCKHERRSSRPRHLSKQRAGVLTVPGVVEIIRKPNVSSKACKPPSRRPLFNVEFVFGTKSFATVCWWTRPRPVDWSKYSGTQFASMLSFSKRLPYASTLKKGSANVSQDGSPSPYGEHPSGLFLPDTVVQHKNTNTAQEHGHSRSSPQREESPICSTKPREAGGGKFNNRGGLITRGGG